jgi:hypothetical protein
MNVMDRTNVCVQLLIRDDGTVVVWQLTPGYLGEGKMFLPAKVTVKIESPEGRKLKLHWNRFSTEPPKFEIQPCVGEAPAPAPEPTLAEKLEQAATGIPIIGVARVPSRGWMFAVGQRGPDTEMSEMLYLSSEFDLYFVSRFVAIENGRKHVKSMGLDPEKAEIVGLKEVPKPKMRGVTTSNKPSGAKPEKGLVKP